MCIPAIDRPRSCISRLTNISMIRYEVGNINNRKPATFLPSYEEETAPKHFFPVDRPGATPSDADALPGNLDGDVAVTQPMTLVQPLKAMVFSDPRSDGTTALKSVMVCSGFRSDFPRS